MSDRTWEGIEQEIREDYLRSDAPENVSFRKVQWEAWLSELIRKEREEAWKEGHHEGLDTGLTIAEFVHENGGTLRLSDVPKPKENPYRKEKQ